jgi:cytochrome c
MNKLIIVFTIVLFTSCKKEENQTFNKKENSIEYGKSLFEGEGNCIACHQAEQTIIGPSIKVIANIYSAKNASIVAFLREESKPIIDPSKYDIMKTNFAVTEEMTDDQLKALEDYILSFSK